MKSYMNKFICLIAVIILSVTSFPKTAFAAERGNLLTAENETDKGSIMIQLEETKNKVPLSDVKFAVVKIADVIEGRFILTDIFSKADVDLNSIQNADQLKKTSDILTDIYKKNNVKNEKSMITDERGTAKIDSIDIGVYLIYPVDIAKYEDIEPFLISIPTFDDKAGHMIYDILVYPKHTPYIGSLIPSYDSSGDHHGIIQTGDTTDIKYLAIIFICSLLVIVWIYLKRKKEVHE